MAASYPSQPSHDDVVHVEKKCNVVQQQKKNSLHFSPLGYQGPVVEAGVVCGPRRRPVMADKWTFESGLMPYTDVRGRQRRSVHT